MMHNKMIETLKPKPSDPMCRGTAMHELFLRPLREPDPRFEQLQREAVAQGRFCVVNALVMNSDKFLIIRRAPWKSLLPNCWDLPGGHVMPGESLETALRREVIEEIGARVDSIDALIAIWDWEYLENHCLKLVRQFEFIATLTKPNHALRVDEHDFTEHRWICESEVQIMLENRVPDDIQMLCVLRRAFQLRAQQP